MYSVRLPLLGQPFVIPQVVGCRGSEQCNRECMKVQLSDKVVDDVGSSVIRVNAIEDVTC